MWQVLAVYLWRLYVRPRTFGLPLVRTLCHAFSSGVHRLSTITQRLNEDIKAEVCSCQHRLHVLSYPLPRLILDPICRPMHFSLHVSMCIVELLSEQILHLLQIKFMSRSRTSCDLQAQHLHVIPVALPVTILFRRPAPSTLAAFQRSFLCASTEFSHLAVIALFSGHKRLQFDKKQRQISTCLFLFCIHILSPLQYQYTGMVKIITHFHV